MTLKFQVLSSDPWHIDFENHLEQLHTVPKKFASYGLLVNLTKCQFTKKVLHSSDIFGLETVFDQIQTRCRKL